MRNAKQTKQRKIGRIKLSDTQDLVVSVTDDEKLDLRVFLNTEVMRGLPKAGYGSTCLMIAGRNLGN